MNLIKEIEAVLLAGKRHIVMLSHEEAEKLVAVVKAAERVAPLTKPGNRTQRQKELDRALAALNESDGTK